MLEKIEKLISVLTDAYIKNWKRGFYLSVILAVILFGAFITGYGVKYIFTEVFGWKDTKELLYLCIIAVSPVYIGSAVERLKNFINGMD
jgi:prolipoprotein diacylglyceryltransferase